MFNPGSQFSRDARSPPLHHPVPQHPIPDIRSPSNLNEPVASSSVNNAGRNPYAPATGPGSLGPQGSFVNDHGPSAAFNSIGNNQNTNTQGYPGSGFSGFQQYLNDPSAQIGLSVGRNALHYGHEYIEKNLNQYVSPSVIKYYFQVSNIYVLRKIKLVLFPWRHTHWTRTILRSGGSGQVEGYATAREDVNSPDMYIPAMAFTTYIFICCVSAGLKGTYHPQLLGLLASKTVAFIFVEILLLKLGTYILSAGSSLLDFVAYSGYKFIGIILTVFSYVIFSSAKIKWSVFIYTATSNSFFLLRSLRYILLPDSNSISTGTQTISPSQRQRRIHFLFIYSFVVQFFLMWLLV